MSEIRLNDTSTIDFRSYIRIKDPISALTHFIGFVAAVFASPLLLSKTGLHHSDLTTLLSVSIYCLSLILLYGASSAYHSFILPEKQTGILKRLDHCSIFLLIAGTYTPICLNAIKEDGGILLLVLIWSLALGGILLKLFFVYCPRYVSSIVYVAMGWLALLKIREIYAALCGPAFFFLLTGGLMYTVGAVIYALKIRINDDWTQHEIFHIFVLLGSLCHYIMIFAYII